MKLPARIAENVSMQNVLQLIREHNNGVDYMRSLTPIPSNTAPGAHTAIGTFGAGNGTTNPPPAKPQAPRWG